MSDTPIFDSFAAAGDDPPEFNRSMVPDSPVGELLFDGRTGRGLTDAEYDEMIRRYTEHGWHPFKDSEG